MDRFDILQGKLPPKKSETPIELSQERTRRRVLNNYRPYRLFLSTDREGVAIYPDNLSMSVDVETPNQQLPTAMISMSFRMTLNDAARILSTHPQQDEIRRQLLA